MIRKYRSAIENPSARLGPGQRAFTLIELLVVISIIALLISLLLPVLKNARAAARNVVCQSQLRQIGIGLNSYLTDSKGVFPNYRQTGGSSVTVWRPYLYPYAGAPTGTDHTDDLGIWHCPEQKRYNNYTDIASYGGNSHFGGWDSDGNRYPGSYVQWKLDMIDQPTTKLAAADCYVAHQGLHATNRFNTTLEQRWFRFNHAGNATNLMFLDAHVITYAKSNYDGEQVRDWFYELN